MCDNLYVTKLCVCDNLYVTKLYVLKCGEEEAEEEVHAGRRSKNKNPTHFCGKQEPRTILWGNAKVPRRHGAQTRHQGQPSPISTTPAT